MPLEASLIQSSYYQIHRARVDYQAEIMAVVIQNPYRSYVRVKMERKMILAAQKSVGAIQAAFRGVKVGK